MPNKPQVKEFVVQTDYKPKINLLYYIDKNGNLCETRMFSKNSTIVAKLNIQKEDGWLYVPKENPKFIRNRDGTTEVPENCVIEIWRYRHSIRQRKK